MKAVCLWSGPRNVSTALMYSFAERPDTRVVDEPLYGHFLRVTGTVHPGRDEVMANVNCDGDAVMRTLLEDSPDNPAVLFMKQMAHHLVEVDKGFLTQTINVFLIRDPEQMLPSLTIQLPEAGLFDTGLKMQCELYDELVKAGQSPAIIDSRELLLDPSGVLSRLCAHLDIPYVENMLRWEAGPIDEDGIWAPHWYHAVHK
ncbi:MAG: sulfotransferase family protein, partial [Gammaproteobacteria bacterium]|nr:sulfotransferase family protein [Gammaproteobacteria bacterium]